MELNINEQKPSVKLIKSVTGKYGWEIKGLGELNKELVGKIEKIDTQLREKFAEEEK